MPCIWAFDPCAGHQFRRTDTHNHTTTSPIFATAGAPCKTARFPSWTVNINTYLTTSCIGLFHWMNSDVKMVVHMKSLRTVTRWLPASRHNQIVPYIVIHLIISFFDDIPLQFDDDSSGITFQGFVRVNMNLMRPINMSLAHRPPSIYEVLAHENTEDFLTANCNTHTTSFYLPKDTVKALHISR